MIWALIPGPIKVGLAWIAAGFAAMLGVWGLAKRDARRDQKIDAGRAYKERLDVEKDIANSNDDPSDGLRANWKRK